MHIYWLLHLNLLMLFTILSTAEGCVYNKTGVTWLKPKSVPWYHLFLHFIFMDHRTTTNWMLACLQKRISWIWSTVKQYWEDIIIWIYTIMPGAMELNHYFSSGACIISSGINCTRVVLYVNLTFYDQHNGSIIPVCALTTSDHNLECFCIHYLTLGKTNILLVYSCYCILWMIVRQFSLISYCRGLVIILSNWKRKPHSMHTCYSKLIQACIRKLEWIANLSPIVYLTINCTMTTLHAIM